MTASDLMTPQEYQKSLFQEMEMPLPTATQRLEAALAAALPQDVNIGVSAMESQQQNNGNTFFYLHHSMGVC